MNKVLILLFPATTLGWIFWAPPAPAPSPSPPPAPGMSRPVTVPVSARAEVKPPCPAPRSRKLETLLDGVVWVKGGGRDFGGSGWFVRPHLVLTCSHVIRGRAGAKVQLRDGTVLDGEVVKEDWKKDLALLKVRIKGNPLPLAGPEPPDLGSRVFLIGHPMKYLWSVSSGVVSHTSRELTMPEQTLGQQTLHPEHPLPNLLQVDCAMNPGNSGGPLLGKDLKVIGMACAIYSDHQGLGFCIGIKSIRDFLP